MARKRASIKGASLKSGITNLTKVGLKVAATKRRNNPQRQALLAQVKRQQRNSGSKVGRIARGGIDIRNTKFDPRVKATTLNSMSVTQLRAHSRKLEVFNDRTTRFVAGANGAPIPAEKFRKYKNLEAQQNMRAIERSNSRKDIKLPGESGVTIGQRQAMLADDNLPRMEGDGVRKPLMFTNRDATQIASVEALDKLIANQQKVLRRGHLPREIRSAREGLYKIIDEFGDAELSKNARRLTNNQLDILWFDYKYAKEIINPYTQAKMLAAQGRDAEILDALEDDISDIHEAINWASQLPKTSGRKSQSKG